MKILVTGGAGFIGSAFVRMLIGETGHHVVNLDKLTYAGNLGHPEALRVRHFLEQDLGARGLLPEILDSPPDAALHNVVAQDHAQLLTVGEVLGQRQRVRDSALTLLVGVIDVA